MVAQTGQLLGEIPGSRPVAHRDGSKGSILGQLCRAQQLLSPLPRCRRQVKYRVGGDIEVGALYPHLPQLVGGAAVPQSDQSRPLHRPLYPAAVFRLTHGTDAVGVEHHRLAKELRPTDDGQVVHQRSGGSAVLQQAPAAGEQGVAAAQRAQHLPKAEPRHGLQAAQVPGELGIVGEYRHRNILAGRQDSLVDGLKDGVVTGIGKAVVSAHDYPVLAPPHLLVHIQAILGHALYRIVGLHCLTTIGTQPLLLLLWKVQRLGHSPVQRLLVGHRVCAAAEVGVNGLLQKFRAEESGMSLGTGQDHRLFLRHGLQS